ncbi:hypothetical protein FA15DRAFT_710050 [Coprinopsis marcescibilis]|uniref:NACHT domain-containing protein n=1 Tax=Coprinopsis marcescibilis TaxID=230819 RepID=A0A5C3KDW8_COPMA|nr:hypothetical protein FA15DRAFT_710050 [Coprinopsis marcescibilis]
MDNENRSVYVGMEVMQPWRGIIVAVCKLCADWKRRSKKDNDNRRPRKAKYWYCNRDRCETLVIALAARARTWRALSLPLLPQASIVVAIAKTCTPLAAALVLCAGQLANRRVHVRVLLPQTGVVVNAAESRATARTCTPAHHLAAALVLRAAAAAAMRNYTRNQSPRQNWQTKGQRTTNWCLNQSAHPVHAKRSTNVSTAVHPCEAKAKICSSKTTRPCVSSVVVRMRNGDECNSYEGRTRILKLQKEERSAAEEEGNFGGGFDYDFNIVNPLDMEQFHQHIGGDLQISEGSTSIPSGSTGNTSSDLSTHMQPSYIQTAALIGDGGQVGERMRINATGSNRSILYGASGTNLQHAHLQTADRINNTYNIHGDSKVIEVNEALRLLGNPKGCAWDPARACLDGTRVVHIEAITSWATSLEADPTTSGARILLVPGPAGSGKSSLAHTICKELSRSGHLVCSVFFDHTGPQPTAEDFTVVLVQGLCTVDDPVKKAIAELIIQNKTLASAPASRQIEDLVLPIVANLPSTRTFVVGIDALDEQRNPSMLKLLRDYIPRLPSTFRFVLTTRPDPLVMQYLENRPHIISFLHPLVGESSKADVKTFIVARLSMTDYQTVISAKLLKAFIVKSEGLFLWAETVLNHIDNTYGHAEELADIIDGASSDWTETETAAGKLEKLYEHILSKLRWNNDRFVEKYSVVMGALVTLQEPLSRRGLAALYSPDGITEDDVHGICMLLRTLLKDYSKDDPTRPIHLLHLSVQEYLVQRAPQPFRIDCEVHHKSLSRLCLLAIQRELTPAKGLFLWAETVLNHIDNTYGHAEELADIIDGASSDWTETETAAGKLEKLYEHILSKLRWNNDRFVEKYSVVMGALVTLQEPLSRRGLAALYSPDGITEDDVHGICMLLRTLLKDYSKDDPTRPIHLLHLSVQEYLVQRAPQPFRIDCEVHHKSLSRLCLLAIQRELTPAKVPILGYSDGDWAWDVTEKNRKIRVLLRPSLTEPLWYSIQHFNAHWRSLREEAGKEHTTLLREIVVENPRPILEAAASTRSKVDMISLQHKVLPHGPPSLALARRMAKIYVSLGRCLHGAKRDAEAFPLLQGAVGLYTPYKDDNLDTTVQLEFAASLTWLGLCLYRLDRPDDALPHVEEAVTICRQLSLTNANEAGAALAHSLETKGYVLDKLKRYDEAYDIDMEVLDLYRRLVVGHPEKFQHRLGLALRNLAWSLDACKKHEEAVVVIQEEVELHRKMMEHDTQISGADLVKSLESQARYLINAERTQGAVECSQEAVQIQRRLVQDNPEKFNAGLAASLHILASNLDDCGRVADAIPFSCEAIEIRRQLAANDPSTFEPKLADSLHNHALHTRKAGRITEAVEYGQDAVEILRRLVHDNPEKFNADLAASLHNLANDLDNCDRVADAIPLLCEAIEIRSQLVANDPSTFEPDLVNSLHDHAIYIETLGRTEEALECRRERDDIRSRLPVQS